MSYDLHAQEDEDEKALQPFNWSALVWIFLTGTFTIASVAFWGAAFADSLGGWVQYAWIPLFVFMVHKGVRGFLGIRHAGGDTIICWDLRWGFGMSTWVAGPFLLAGAYKQVGLWHILPYGYFTGMVCAEAFVGGCFFLAIMGQLDPGDRCSDRNFRPAIIAFLPTFALWGSLFFVVWANAFGDLVLVSAASTQAVGGGITTFLRVTEWRNTHTFLIRGVVSDDAGGNLLAPTVNVQSPSAPGSFVVTVTRLEPDVPQFARLASANRTDTEELRLLRNALASWAFLDTEGVIEETRCVQDALSYCNKIARKDADNTLGTLVATLLQRRLRARASKGQLASPLGAYRIAPESLIVTAKL